MHCRRSRLTGFAFWYEVRIVKLVSWPTSRAGSAVGDCEVLDFLHLGFVHNVLKEAILTPSAKFPILFATFTQLPPARASGSVVFHFVCAKCPPQLFHEPSEGPCAGDLEVPEVALQDSLAVVAVDVFAMVMLEVRAVAVQGVSVRVLVCMVVLVAVVVLMV